MSKTLIVMKKIEIESWALRVLGKAKDKASIEDSLVELKAEWPTPVKAARRIAGHSNSARGENILWLIGVDEDKGIVGADLKELSIWWPQVQSCFDAVTPDFDPLNVSFDGKTVVALCFDTSRAPFVVQNPAFGKTAGEPMQWEVPWREATKIRSATRNDLINLLLPQVQIPTVEILDAGMTVSSQLKNHITAFLVIYVIPKSPAQLIFPAHKCEVVISFAGQQLTASHVVFDTPMQKIRRKITKTNDQYAMLNKVQLTPLAPSPSLVEATPEEAVVRGAGKILLEGMFPLQAIQGWQTGVELKVTFIEAHSGTRIPIVLNLVKDNRGGTLVWDRKSVATI